MAHESELRRSAVRHCKAVGDARRTDAESLGHPRGWAACSGVPGAESCNGKTVNRAEMGQLMDLSTLPVTHQSIIPESYQDAMGHMNVMWYTHLFAKATVELFKLGGLSREYCQDRQAGMFALQQFFCYHAEVLVGEEVTIRSRVLGRSAKRIHLMHFMNKDRAGKLAATAEFVSTHIDMTVRRTSPWPAEIARTLDQLVETHSRLGWEAPISGALRA
jgi:acyl-CoA thioester hydrolase